jgi:hypothetical protein
MQGYSQKVASEIYLTMGVVFIVAATAILIFA